MSNNVLASVYLLFSAGLLMVRQEQHIIQQRSGTFTVRGQLKDSEDTISTTVGYGVLTKRLCAHKMQLPIDTHPLSTNPLAVGFSPNRPLQTLSAQRFQTSALDTSRTRAPSNCGGVEQEAAIKEVRGYPHLNTIREEEDTVLAHHLTELARDQIRTVTTCPSTPTLCSKNLTHSVPMNSTHNPSRSSTTAGTVRTSKDAEAQFTVPYIA